MADNNVSFIVVVFAALACQLDAAIAQLDKEMQATNDNCTSLANNGGNNGEAKAPAVSRFHRRYQSVYEAVQVRVDVLLEQLLHQQ